MTRLILLALLAVDPPIPARVLDGGAGELDAPVLILLDGRKLDLSDGKLAADPDDARQGCYTVAQCVPQGVSCLAYDKAASVRDDLADKNARVASLEKSLGTNWPVVAIVAAVGLVVAGVAAGAGYAAGRQSPR